MNTLLWRLHAERILSEITDAPIRQYSTYDFGRIKHEGAISVIISDDDSMRLVQEVREELQPGLVAFIGTTRWLGDEKPDGVELVIAPGETQFDILVTAQSNAANYDMMTGDLIKKLQAYDRLYGIDIIQAETDTVQFILLTPPSDMKTFAQDLYEFCPDIVDQGVGDINQLAELIHETQHVMLWWD